MSITRHQSKNSGDDSGPKLHVVTFGCQMNKYDSSLVEGRFARSGYQTTDVAEDADVLLFNTCSVRDHAEERTWSWIGELKRLKERRPELVVGAAGCMAQRVEEEVFRRAGHVDLVAERANSVSSTCRRAWWPMCSSGAANRACAQGDAHPGHRHDRRCGHRSPEPSTRAVATRTRGHARMRPQLHLLHRAHHPRAGSVRARSTI
ncbi:MAG: hypothetical protein R3F17_00665 [Planctomycetota bacterium]